MIDKMHVLLKTGARTGTCVFTYGIARHVPKVIANWSFLFANFVGEQTKGPELACRSVAYCSWHMLDAYANKAILHQ